MSWTCADCHTGYDADLSMVCCNPWYDRSVPANPYEE